MIKMDTDEFLTLYDDTTKLSSMNGTTIKNHMLNLNDNGFFQKNGFVGTGWLLKEQCDHESSIPRKDMARVVTHWNWFPTLFIRHCFYKTVYPSNVVAAIDLGGHTGEHIRGGAFNGNEPNCCNQTRLGIIHLRSQCFENVRVANHQAVVSHKYIDDNWSKEQQITTLETLSSRSIASIHKVWLELALLKDPEGMEKRYYNDTRVLALSTDSPFRDIICDLYTRYSM